MLIALLAVLGVELIAVDGLVERRLADPDEVNRLGKRPTLIRVSAGGATVEVVADEEHAEQLLGPYHQRDL